MAKKVPGHGNAPISKLKLAALVSERIEIRGIRLVESTVRRSLDCEDIPTKMSLGLQTSTTYDKGSNTVSVHVHLTVSGRYEDTENTENNDENSPPLQISAHFMLRYELQPADGLTADNFQAFGELNGVYNCWPYCREFVQSTLARMGFPPIPLPVYRALAKGQAPGGID